MRWNPIIGLLLTCLMTCNALLSATGGVSVYFHHDYSFHLDRVVETHSDELEYSSEHLVLSDHEHHHHHELELDAVWGPTIRTNVVELVQAPPLMAVFNLFDAVIIPRSNEMATGGVIRPPPDWVDVDHLSILRTQVLRL